MKEPLWEKITVTILFLLSLLLGMLLFIVHSHEYNMERKNKIEEGYRQIEQCEPVYYVERRFGQDVPASEYSNTGNLPTYVSHYNCEYKWIK